MLNQMYNKDLKFFGWSIIVVLGGFLIGFDTTVISIMLLFGGRK
jgi:hypothetical protein